MLSWPHYIWSVDTLIQPSHHPPPGPTSQTLEIASSHGDSPETMYRVILLLGVEDS